MSIQVKTDCNSTLEIWNTRYIVQSCNLLKHLLHECSIRVFNMYIENTLWKIHAKFYLYNNYCLWWQMQIVGVIYHIKNIKHISAMSCFSKKPPYSNTAWLLHRMSVTSFSIDYLHDLIYTKQKFWGLLTLQDANIQ